MPEGMDRGEQHREVFERNMQRIEFLRDRGWAKDDAWRYTELHEIWLQDELGGLEGPDARALEERYNAPPDFAIFHELPIHKTESE